MTLPIPLTVRLSTTRADRHITADLHDLSFRSVVPGGFASARFTLSRPLTLQPDEIAYYGRVVIYDARNGNTVWEGRLEDPGRGVGADGELWELAAVGPSAYLQDRTLPLIYIDRDQGRWLRDILEAQFIAPSATAGASTHPRTDAIDALLTSWPEGLTITSSPSSRVSVGYYGFVDSGMTIGAYFFSYSDTASNANLNTEAVTGVSPTYASIDYAAAFDGVGTSVALYVIDDFVAGRDIAGLRTRRTAGGPTTLSADTWTAFYDVRILGRRMNKAGTLVSGVAGMVTTQHVRASWVVEDLLGRLLDQFDGANATVETTSYDIDQFAYPDGVTAAAVLEDLALLEPGYYPATWERTKNDKYRFEYKAWPTNITYEADVKDGYSSTGSAEGLYNIVRVRWRDARGRIRTTQRTQTVAELADAGLTREGFVDLADNLGSSANAIRIGDQWLADHATPLNQGQLTVSRPIYDRDRGMMVQPWEIRPGKLIQVRGILANADALNATSRDGVTVFKVIASDYHTKSASATLELDSQPLTLSHMLARINLTWPGVFERRRR